MAGIQNAQISERLVVTNRDKMQESHRFEPFSLLSSYYSYLDVIRLSIGYRMASSWNENFMDDVSDKNISCKCRKQDKCCLWRIFKGDKVQPVTGSAIVSGVRMKKR